MNHLRKISERVYENFSEVKIETNIETIKCTLDAIAIGKRVYHNVPVEYKGHTNPSLMKNPHGFGSIVFHTSILKDTQIRGVWNNGIAVGNFTVVENGEELLT